MKRFNPYLSLPKTTCSRGPAMLALALAWPTQAADLDLIGQWPGWKRGPALDVVVDGNYAYVATGSGGLQVIDMSNPAFPRRVGGYPDECFHVEVSGNYAYVVGYPEGLQVIDVSDPANLQPVGAYDTMGYISYMALSGDYAYLGRNNYIQVIEVSNPANPQLVASYFIKGDATSMAVNGNYACVAYSGTAGDADGMEVMDISIPTNPQRISDYKTGMFPHGVALNGNYVYVGGSRWTGSNSVGHLQVIDVSNPTNPQRVSGYDTSGLPSGVAVSRSYAYMSEGSRWINDKERVGSLQVLNLSNPASPQRVGGYNTSGSAIGVTASGNYAYVADGEGGLLILGFKPRITGITKEAGTATVHYTNTIPGTDYTLEYRTSLTTGDWQPVGMQPASGESASQTDTSASTDQRYYRVFPRR